MELPQAYHVLGVRPGATPPEVRDAHDRQLAGSPPPDRIAQIRDAAASIHAAGYPSWQPPPGAPPPPGPGGPPPGFAPGPPPPAPGNPWQLAPPPPASPHGWQGAPPPQQGYPFAQPANKKKGAGAAIGFGALLLVVGIAITAGTHEAAANSGGGTYVIAYGPMIFGAISILRGLKMLAS